MPKAPTRSTRKRDTPEDIRFTTRDGAIYAFLIEWPGKPATIKSLAKGNPHESRAVKSVELLGGSALTFE